MTDRPNLLYYGDNLDVLTRHGKDESVDIVYLDPPFNSDANYNVLFAEHDGTKATAQIKAFGDTWHWDQAAADAYYEVVGKGGKPAETMLAFRTMLGDSDMLAYLSMMAPRLLELHRVLKPTGSLYLHCDPTASHYLKLLLDAIFGAKHFQNEIVWYYKGAGISPKRWGRRHDILLWYSKGSTWFFDPDKVRDPYAETTKARFAHHIGNKRGGADYGEQQLNPGGKHPDDVWLMPIIAPSAKERLGYPTQKPEALLERIIASSCPPGGVVLDPFCGCGTAIDVAQRLGSTWIGIDITHLAVGLIKHRLADAYGPDISKTYRVIGEPTTVDDAKTLAAEDPHQFEAWALGLVGARIATSGKHGGDKGVDGRLYFRDGAGDTKTIALSVKAGKLAPTFVRDLRGVIDRDSAAIGVLLSFEQPTSGMRAEAASAGFLEVTHGFDDGAKRKYPRIQLLTIGEILGGATISYPNFTGANGPSRPTRSDQITGGVSGGLSLIGRPP